MTHNLQKLLRPNSLAVIGGRSAEAVVAQCRAIGYDGEIWPVHPNRDHLSGIPTFASIADLPGVPDAAFIAVNREATLKAVDELARLGSGGVVCHASGFAEEGEYGARLQNDLIKAAGDMALIGPNCLGLINYLDGLALWPDQHGGVKVDRGVAIIGQSGAISQNLTMQRRSLPIAMVVTIGNSAVTGVVDLIAAMLDDPRITAIGLCIEEIPDLTAFSKVATEALRRKVPIVALKTGASELGARVALGHTSALADSDVLVDTLFRRLGIARVTDEEALVETLKLVHVQGGGTGTSITSASSSGGEAALVADLAHRAGLEMPEFSNETQTRLHAVLGDRVSVSNPLDYHAYIWGDGDKSEECFAALLESGFDQHLLVLDFPRGDRCETDAFETQLKAWQAACQKTGARACVVSAMSENIPEDIGNQLLRAGIAPMQGLSNCLAAIAAAATIGAAQETVDTILPFRAPVALSSTSTVVLEEVEAKAALAAYGVPVPASVVIDDPAKTSDAASALGFPVVLKAVGQGLAHKSDVGGVAVGLESPDAVLRATAKMGGLGNRFLIERMVSDVVIELLVGVHRDPRLGLALTLGAGGVLVELLADTATLLLPASRAEILNALSSLRIGPVLKGFRGRAGDLNAVVDAIENIARFAADNADNLLEVEVNPLLVLPNGAVAVDALIRFAEAGPEL